ncbi:MAG TPA: HlyD family efflux transporter periplasmic adaptor subunit [bacterium]|nr:HlyD family efflux transporter periplasmic adaptor subunit [bacterium]
MHTIHPRVTRLLPPWLPVLAGTLLFAGGCGETVEVESVQPRRGAIEESFSEPAQTRLETTYLITMPLAGEIGRIELEPGDPVEAGQELARYDLTPFQQEVEESRALVNELEAGIALSDYNKLEETAKIETVAMIASIQETLKAAQAQVDAEKRRSERSAKELDRIQKLATEKSVSQSQLDDAQLNAETALIELRKQEFLHTAMKAIQAAVELGPRFVDEFLGRKQLQRSVLGHKLAQAQARLARAEHDSARAAIRSPINGVVLERYELGDRYLPAGQQLLQLGDLKQLEVIADVLTQDALRLAPGSPVSLEPAAGFPPIPGVVKRIEPAGFTKLSSLGVEQQRVNVIVSFQGPHDKLGAGYQLQARFLTGSKADTLIIPRSCVMQDVDQRYYVMAIAQGSLKKKIVALGFKSDLEMEILEGLSPEDTLVLHPDATLRDGARVRIVP